MMSEITADVLPGGAFAIARVVPEGETGLCDFATWGHEGLPSTVSEGGVLTAAVPETLAEWAYTKVVSVVPGKHYALRAEMRRDTDASGFLLGTLTTSGKEGQSDPPAGGDWEVV